MTKMSPPPRGFAEKLRDRISLSLAVDDTLASELSRRADALASAGDHEGARAIVEAVRRHRVGAVKHRALMSAKGLTF